MLFPKQLKPGDTVLLIAPSSPLRTISPQACAEGLERLGFKVRIGASVYMSTRKGYAAAPAHIRAEDINRGFKDDTIDALWAVRGGSMAAEVLPFLDYAAIASHPKPLIGFSDITSLHSVLQGKCGIVSIHGPNASLAAEGDPDPYAWSALMKLMNMQERVEFENSASHPYCVLHDGHAEGELVGGNLTVVTSLVGTEYAVNTTGKILFLEDVDEDVYRLDRMLRQLKMSGMLDRAEGLMFGDFTDSVNGYNAEYTPEELIKEFFADDPRPIYYGLTAGHIRENGALPMGMKCVMENGKITFSR